MSAQNLAAWLDQTGITKSHLASSIGVTKAAVTYYVSGRRVPRIPIARVIETYTDGAVPATSWPKGLRRETRGQALLLDWMRQYDLTISDVARFFNISNNTVGDMIRGRRRPSEPTLRKLRAEGPKQFADLKAEDFR